MHELGLRKRQRGAGWVVEGARHLVWDEDEREALAWSLELATALSVAPEKKTGAAVPERHACRATRYAAARRRPQRLS